MWLKQNGQALGAPDEPRDSETRGNNVLAAPATMNATPASTIVDAPVQTFRDCLDCPEMVVVPAGIFLMSLDYPFAAREFPPRMEIINWSFPMAKTVVKQGQWRAIMGVNSRKFLNCGDSCPCGDDCPVGSASWEDTHEFIRRLNLKTGKQYRLPSKVEWEYAFGLRNISGLLDISNPVFEWVEDRSPDDHNAAQLDGGARQGNSGKRIIRGGWWFNSPELLHEAIRGGSESALRQNRLGLRLARTLP